MPRRTSQRPSAKPRRSDNPMTVLISFVVHSINRWRGKPNDSPEAFQERKRIETRGPWRAVEIVSSSFRCAASKQVKGKRFLCTEAPKLPLPGCNAAQCNCRYKHFSDRRAGPRRADDSGVYVHLFANSPESDRRRARGRRSTDS